MNLLKMFKGLKTLSLESFLASGPIGIVWSVVKSLAIKLIQKKMPGSIAKPYENLIKYSNLFAEGLFELKKQVKESPSELDDYYFNQGVSAIEKLANYLIRISLELRT